MSDSSGEKTPTPPVEGTDHTKSPQLPPTVQPHAPPRQPVQDQTAAEPPSQPSQKSGTPSPNLQQDPKYDGSNRSPQLRFQDLTSAADLRCSFSHPHMARPLEIMESIKGLHELHQQGGLTQEEFTQAKQQILDSGSSAMSAPSSKSHRSQKRRHRRHGRRSSKSSSSSDSRSSHRTRNNNSSSSRSRAKSKSTRHRSSRRSKFSNDSSSSSTSSDSSDDCFIVVPRANVWRSLNTRLNDGSIDHDSAILHLSTSPDGFVTVRSPLLTGSPNTGGCRATPGEEVPFTTQQVTRSRADRYEPIPGDDPLSRRDVGAVVSAGAGVVGDSEDAGIAAVNVDVGDVLVPSPNSVGLAAGSATGSAGAATVAAVRARQPGSLTGSDTTREKNKYGTFLNREEAVRVVGSMASVRAELNREDVVRVKYFNSRGRAGNHFSDVELHTSELREPVFLHKGRSQVVYEKPTPNATALRRSKDDPAIAMLPSQDSQVFHLTEMTPDERKAWEEMSSLPSRSSASRSSKSSYLEQSLNWYWIDVTGRDPSRKRYNATLRFLTSRFKLCESFLVDRDHMLVLPQVCESPNYPDQYLLNLRVATDKIAISDDSVMELTNRWIIVVDLRQHIVITLHRVDTHSMANLRMLWRKVIENNDVSFQEFLLKIIDDAIRTYQTSIDVHADILDKCEAKLFVETSSTSVPVASGHYVDMRILHHFAGSSRSLFLRRLLDDKDRSPMNKGEMNSFLHHLHRRTSVQHRMLNLTQTVLVKAFTKLRLCSKEMADQMCASCIEISDRALEVRDDAKTLLDLHISLQSFRTNELMAVLTRVSLLFTPVTFLAGVYGMNFQKNFPELTWEYGYPFFWVMCLVLVFVMQIFFLREQ
jgi:Mg2+ and Co2+ transporter CorA